MTNKIETIKKIKYYLFECLGDGGIYPMSSDDEKEISEFLNQLIEDITNEQNNINKMINSDHMNDPEFEHFIEQKFRYAH